MKTNLNFNSAICTSREQSERLLALGLKKVTADCAHCYTLEEHGEYKFWDIVISDWEPYWDIDDENIPAWSLNRLIEMIPNRIKYKNDYYHFNIFSEITGYNVDYVDPDDNYYNLLGHRHNNLFEGVISLIEWLIKEEYFNKEYLEE